ncbi:hypothetical protein NG895_23415 [Aeoliella sp. ICT_H6.2]|uniref:Uncharacterized protein n=1 Tax=Aeoliella straminimaris TaxID=2954799 RepID=A0A9X2JKM1_9BACT|nr:hypothetical protein [Aeoliella straminimaris]MCO6046859.1 hypothetical protein [Aeoliella straminimaris]
MLDFLAETVFQPAMGVLQGVAGLMWPSKDAEVLRLQRWCLACLVGFLSATALTVVALSLAWWMLALPPAVVAFVLGLACGKLGARIEKKCSD